MGQRSIGSFTLTFGLLNIPLKMYLSASAEHVSFRQMTKNNNPVKQVLVDSVTLEEVKKEDLLKGYEHAKNQFVIFDKEEVDALASEKCDTANIEEYVPLNTVEPMCIEKTLYLAPDKGADKGYLLFAAALQKTKSCAVAKLYARGREHLVVIVGVHGTLIMHQMYYPNEMRTFDNPCSKLPITDEELELATLMIKNSSSKTFGDVQSKPKLYRDNYIDRINEAVQTKLKGGTVQSGKKADTVQGGDLLDLLKASLGQKTQMPVNDSAKKGKKKKA